ncbi:MerR family transcriptional regulator, partial [Actinomadura roseirufa]|uniref:MerR family transcriptional regulator n=1 Tax=Actinomadura roseirufa TaxID=2094049 RepID=UPI001F5F54BD
MRITEAARRLGTSPRMLRYRETLGLLPATRDHAPSGGGPGHARHAPGAVGRPGHGGPDGHVGGGAPG